MFKNALYEQDNAKSILFLNYVLFTFQKYKELIENQTVKKIKLVKFNNEGEYCSKKFKDYLEKYGINRMLTVPYALQQNGVAKNRNRILFQMARCMLIQADLSLSFWAEAIAAANQIRNHDLPSSFQGKNPLKCEQVSKWSSLN